jgi:uncharacterized membrane protein YdjX (TVP38/TMEM64 family)
VTTSLRSAGKIARFILLALWAAVLATSAIYYIAHPAEFTAANIAVLIGSWHTELWLVYFLMSALRGLTLLPSTPFVLAGVIMFPTEPVSVFLVSLGGIVLSSTMIYYFSELLGFHDYFERRDPERTGRLRSKLEHPLGFLFVAVWAFFPLVPTDLVCYLAGTARMNYWKFIAAVLAGEAILCSIYIFFGGSLMAVFR